VSTIAAMKHFKIGDRVRTTDQPYKAEWVGTVKRVAKDGSWAEVVWDRQGTQAERYHTDWLRLVPRAEAP
jgi:hypothetical protein